MGTAVSRGETSVLFPRVPDSENIFAEPGGKALTIDAVISRSLEGRRIQWNSVARPAVRSLMEMAGVELDLPPSMLSNTEFIQPLSLLGGHTLGSMYAHVNLHRERKGRNIVGLIQDTVGIGVTASDVIEAIRKGKKIAWKLVPRQAAVELLEAVADALGTPASMLSYDDLQYPNVFLRGGSLCGVLSRSNNHPKRGEQGVMAFILHDLGFAKNAPDIISYTRSRSRPGVQWKGVPWQETHTLLTQAASELSVPANMLTLEELRQTKFDFYGGASFKGMVRYCARHPEKTADETTMQFIRRKLGLPEPAQGSRARFRFTQMLGYMTPSDGIGPEAYTKDGVAPWVSSVAMVYSRRHQNVDLQEIENEIILFLDTNAAKGVADPAIRLSTLHKHLETYVGNMWTRLYREKLLTTPIRDTDDTLGDSLLAPPIVSATAQEWSPHLAESLSSLSERQRELVLGVAVDGRSFEELAGELQTDIDMLAEQYDDALELLREGLASR